jgi:hypothetical protein
MHDPLAGEFTQGPSPLDMPDGSVNLADAEVTALLEQVHDAFF